MSGKPKRQCNPNTQSGWGGARKGTGRKPITHLSEKEAKTLFREIRKRSKLEGKTWQSTLMDFVMGAERDKDGNKLPLQMTAKERLTALRLVADLAVAKQSEQTVNVNKTEGPGIYLPERKPDPAKLEIVPGGRT